MAVLVTFTIGLIWWVCAWSFGIKAFDAFLLTVFMTVVAAAVVILKPFLDRLLRREPEPLEERGAAR
jgi:membrane protein implicated in regulation of membrane protease activity